MYRLFFIFFVVLASFVSTQSAYAIDKQAAKQFEQVTSTAFGVLSTFPEEIRSRRSRSMQHKITVSDDGILTIQFSFPCHNLPEEGRKAKELQATSYKQFFLQDFIHDSNKKYEINYHLNTMAFFDRNVAWVIAFKTGADLSKAGKLFETLLKTAQEPVKKKLSAAKVAKSCGFKYVVFAPRADSTDEEMRLLKATEHPTNLWCWLTKSNPSSPQEILPESLNAFPLFFYDINILDDSSFYTVSEQGMSSFCQCTLGNEVKQSVFSDEEGPLKSFLETSPFVGIRFQTLPICSTPQATFFSSDLKKLEHKGRTRGVDVENSQHIHLLPEFTDDEIPIGTNSCWLTGLNENSSDILRYVLWNNKLSRSTLSKIIYKEFPELSTLLKTKSQFRKDLSLEDCILSCTTSFSKIQKDLSPLSKRVIQIACFTHELGASFGSEIDLFYNTWPLALAVAEKMGLQENEIQVLQLLIQQNPLLEEKTKGKELSIFMQEASQANTIGIPLGEWLQLKMSFYLILSQQFKTPPVALSLFLKKLHELSSLYPNLTPFCIPFGMQIFKGSLPTKHLFSTYIWEARDKAHRDGLALKRRRDRYERLMVEKPKSPWRERFWDWMDRECEKDKIFPGIYLESATERAPYIAVFENGELISPSFPNDEIEVMFVIDSKGSLYIGEKKEALSNERPGFSHASFLAGSPVASAGKMVLQNHHIVSISNHSGHYRPGPNEMQIALVVLKTKGVDTSKLSIKKVN